MLVFWFYPDNMDILANLGFPSPILASAINVEQYWLNLGIGFMLEADIGPLLAHHWPTAESGPDLGP